MIDKLIRSHFYRAILLFIFVIFLGVFGYYWWFSYTFVDALYMTIITVTTVGFGEVHPFGVEEKIFSIVLILVSFFTFGYTISSVSEYVLSGNFFKKIRKQRVEKQIEKLRGHVIVCGFGRNGEEVVRTLYNHGCNIVVVDTAIDSLSVLNSYNNVYAIKGDATLDEMLIRAGIYNAASLITSLPSDADNLFVVLTSKQLNPNCRVVSRATSESAYNKLKFSGADNVIMPNKLGGGHMASLIVVPDLIEFVDNLKLDGDKNANLREIAIDDLSDVYIGKTILDLDLRKKTGCNVIGFKDSSGEYVINPDVSTVLEKGTCLILLGKSEQIELLKDLI